MPLKELSHTVEASDEGRLDLLVARLLALPRAQVRGLLSHGAVTLNGDVGDSGGALLVAGDLVAVRYDPHRRYHEKPRERAPRGFSVVYLDEHLVVVDKEAGVLTVPTSRGETSALTDLLAAHLGRGQARHRKVSVVHRLDRETSGLLVFARSPAGARDLIAQFAGRKPEREYAVLVAGLVKEAQGTIRSHLATDKALNQRSVSTGGELAVTHFTVVERYLSATRLAVRLETGRRNQIRVHMAEQGHPVLGDTRYRATEAAHQAWPYHRLALHARILGFRHPVGGKEMRFESVVPREFAAFAASQG